MVDDRETFQRQARDNARALAGDDELNELNVSVISRSDIHEYSYMWQWLGLPIIQMPTDIVAIQEIIWATKPEVIVETGVARGGSAILHNSMLKLLGQGVVVAVDVDIRPHNRAAIEAHPLSEGIQLIEGSSTDPGVIQQIGQVTAGVERVMVVLDSDHTHEHVLRELELYTDFVSPGMFMVVADTVVEEIPPQVTRPRHWGPGNNPQTAVDQFMREHPGVYEVDEFTNSKLLMSSSRGGYLRKL